MSEFLKNNAVIVCTGDSVTDCGREYPIGEGNNRLGNGYPQYLHGMIDSTYPEKHIRVINAGISGNTSRDLKGRYQKDVLALKPDYITILIGINDIWRKFDAAYWEKAHVDIEEYTSNLREMIEATQKEGITLLLISPFFMNTNALDSMRKEVDIYRSTCKSLAEEYRLPFVDVQKDMDHYFKYNHYMGMSWDGVHPNHVGHMMIMKAVYQALKKI